MDGDVGTVVARTGKLPYLQSFQYPELGFLGKEKRKKGEG